MITVDLKQHSAKDGRRYLIQNGDPVAGFQIRTEPVTFDELEQLYQTYKHSTPNTKRLNKQYFKADAFEDMSTSDVVSGANRNEAQEALEMTLLQGILNGSLKWPDPAKWFWQSETDKDFVLLREWFQINREEDSRAG